MARQLDKIKQTRPQIVIGESYLSSITYAHAVSSAAYISLLMSAFVTMGGRYTGSAS